MSGSQVQSQVRVAGHDGRTPIRADAIMAVGQEDGQVTARLAGADGLEVLLVAGTDDDAPILDGFHRQLIRAVAEAAYAGGARLILANRDDGGWHWVTGPVLDDQLRLRTSPDFASTTVEAFGMHRLSRPPAGSRPVVSPVGSASDGRPGQLQDALVDRACLPGQSPIRNLRLDRLARPFNS